MDWDDVRVFLALARRRRLGAAAKSLGQDATTVGRRVARLEQQLRTRLFEKSLGRYLMTEDGQALLTRAEAMEVEAFDIDQTIGRGAHDVTGPIRLSVSEGFGSRFLAPRLAEFTRANPGITLDLIASTGFLNPSRREADLAIMLSRPQTGQLLVRKLTEYTLGLYAKRGRYPFAFAESDLIEQPLIGYVPDHIYAPELHYLAEVDSRLNPTIRSSSINAQAELIAAGAGFGILPAFIGDTIPELERLLADRLSISRNFWLVVHRDVRHIARIERFVAWLDDVIKQGQPLLLGESRESLST